MTDAGRTGTSGGRAGTSGWRQDLPFLAAVAAGLVVVLVVNALSDYEERAGLGRPVPLWEPVVWEFSSGAVLLAMTPLVLALTRRAWPLGAGWPRRLAVHLLAATALSLAHVGLMGPLRTAAYAMAGGSYDPLGPLADWPYELRKDLLAYLGLVTLYVGWRLLRDRPEAPSGGGAGAVLEVRDGARRHFVPLAEVAWIEAAGNYVELHRGGAAILHRAPLSAMERQLADAGFVRIHRSRLVRRGAVAQVESKPTGDFVVRLHDGRELAGSRRYRKPLLEP